MAKKREKTMERVICEDGRYPLAAYEFLHEGLAQAVKDAYGEGAETGPQRHVTGRQLCQTLRNLAIKKWGLLARTVLERWNIRATLDFGNMVYLLISHDFMGKTEEDSLEDFRGVFDFDEAFPLEGEFELKE